MFKLNRLLKKRMLQTALRDGTEMDEGVKRQQKEKQIKENCLQSKQ